jgi:N-acetylglucosaminyl-diphospho-decaprenol L-rhamnosyltransferase
MTAAVVTIAHGRHEHLCQQLRSLMSGTRKPEHYVVVVMDDPEIASLVEGHPLRPLVVTVQSRGRDLPLARARNAGARAAIDSGADTMILMDVDCMAGPELVSGYQDAVRGHQDTVWSGPVSYLPPPPLRGYDIDRLAELDDPHPARPAPAPGELLHPAEHNLFWSLSFALHPETWKRIGGFCEDYTGYGAEDTDFAYLAVSLGVHFGWTGTARAYHQHHPTSDPPVQHLESILRNATLFHRRWGSWPMLGWFEAFERLGLVTRTHIGWELTKSAGT